MKVLIIDDNPLWIAQGKKLLELAGYSIAGFVVREPDLNTFTQSILSTSVRLLLEKTEALLIDKDFGSGITSTRFICVVRHNFPKLPIIRWTGGRETNRYMEYLGISCTEKPTKKDEGLFVEEFKKLLNIQNLILSGPMGIFSSLEESIKPSAYATEQKEARLKQIAQIAQLANAEKVDSGNWQYPWMITGKHGDVTKHELGHCICDGLLTAHDIRPHLPNLQKVIAKFEAANNIDNRFKICAEFLKTGNLDELEFVFRCF